MPSSVEEARFLAHHMINEALANPFASQTETLDALRTQYGVMQERLPERDRQYLDRELSSQLAANPRMRVNAALSRNAVAYDPLMSRNGVITSGIFSLEDIKNEGIVSLLPTEAPPCNDEEKAVANRLMEGKSFADAIVNHNHVTKTMWDLGMELGPVGTLRYAKAVSPEVIDDAFTYRMGIHTVLGMNATKPEEYNVNVLRHELAPYSESVRQSFESGKRNAERELHIDAEKWQKMLSERPLATEELEEARRHNRQDIEQFRAEDFATLKATKAFQEKVSNVKNTVRQFLTKTMDSMPEEETVNAAAAIPHEEKTQGMDIPHTDRLDQLVASYMVKNSLLEDLRKEQKHTDIQKNAFDTYVVGSIKDTVTSQLGTNYELGGSDCSLLTWDVMKGLKEKGLLSSKLNRALNGPKMNAETQSKLLKKTAGVSFEGIAKCSPEALQKTGYRVFHIEMEKKERYPDTQKMREMKLAGDHIHHAGILIINEDGTQQFLENTSMMKKGSDKNGVQINSWQEKYQVFADTSNHIRAVPLDPLIAQDALAALAQKDLQHQETLQASQEQHHNVFAERKPEMYSLTDTPGKLSEMDSLTDTPLKPESIFALPKDPVPESPPETQAQVAFVGH